MRQEAVEREEEAAQGSATAAGAELHRKPKQAGAAQRRRGVDVPGFGSRFSDKELAARLGVPLQGGIRVSRENECIAIVDRMAESSGSYADIGVGDTIVYEGQDLRGGDKGAVLALDGANLDLALSKARGYTVLYFVRVGSALVFNKVLECDSVCFEKRGDGRTAVVFRMRVVVDIPVDYERLNPEIESALQEIENGTFVGEEYAADEFIEYIKKVL